MACCFLEVVKRGERETVARRGAAIEQNPVSRGRNQVHYPPLLLLLLPLHRKREATCQCGGCPPAQPSPAHATVAGPIKLDRQMFCHQSQRTGWAGLGSCLTFPVNISSLQPRLHTAPQPLHIGTLDTSPAEQCSAQQCSAHTSTYK